MTFVYGASDGELQVGSSESVLLTTYITACRRGTRTTNLDVPPHTPTSIASCSEQLSITFALFITTSCIMGSDWKKLAEDKKSRIVKSVPLEWIIKDQQEGISAFDYANSPGLLSEQELKWTNSSATDLVAQLAKGKLKSVDLTTAFCKRAAIAQQLVGDMIPF